MAVVPMKRLELFALRRDRKAILELLQRRGVVEVESTQPSRSWKPRRGFWSRRWSCWTTPSP